MSGIPSRNPFTAAQWQELEHQALFFKFMVSGLPIPPDLIFSIKGRTSLPHHHTGRACFQLGLSQKNIDPEPNRCRRTDGKKWRCSRQTTGDSKYCERHMHRGKSRPRKLHRDSSKPLQTFPPYKSCSSTPRNSSKPVVKDSNFMTFLGIETPYKSLSEKGGERVMYHQFIEESPPKAQGRRDSWLNLNLVI